MTIKRLMLYSWFLLAVAASLLIVSLMNVSKSNQVIKDAQETQRICLALAEELKDSSRNLNSAVKKFVVTGDERYAEEYETILMVRLGNKPRSNNAEIAPGQSVSLDELMNKADYTNGELDILREAFSLSDELVNLEIEAINAVRGLFPDGGGNYTVRGKPDRDRAISLIFSPVYEAEVEKIMNPFIIFKQELDDRLAGIMSEAQDNHSRSIFIMFGAFGVLIAMFALFLRLVARFIVKPVVICDKFAREVAAGNHSAPLNYKSGNEIGSLAESLRAMLTALLENISLEENMRYYSAVIASADAGIIVKDKDGIVREWNVGAENIFGFKAGEVIGHTTKYYTPEQSHAEVDQIQLRLKKGEHISHADVLRRHKNGRIVDCSASYTPIFGDDGQFVGSVAIFHDVTEKKLAEKKAKEMAAIIAAADAGIVVRDPEDNILEWNTGAQNILGYKAEEVIGKNSGYYVREEDYPEYDEVKKRLEKGEHTASIEVRRIHKDGRLIDCSATYTPIFDEKGIFAGSVSVFQDISYQKHIEAELKKAVRAAEEASVAKSMFLANTSHEIRTPMNGIIGFAELALDNEDVSGDTRDYLSKINTSAHSLLEIINDILDISKIEAGAIKIEKIPFELHSLFKECEAISSPKAREKKIATYFYAEPSIGKRFLGDPTKLRQVLLNLLSNAIKFTNHGIVKMTAVVEEQNDNSVNIHFEVRDSGIGMNAEQVERVFDPFVQADSSTTRKYGGTGLGLAITKSFISMMGGELKVESTPGLGSKFGFNLEFETVEYSDGNTDGGNGTHSEIQKPVFKGEVLICEDNIINQEVVVKHLKRIGLDTVVAANGKKGVDVVVGRMRDGKPFDLILMDIHMPVMDGLEAMKKLNEMGSKIPVVALTANAMVTDKENYLKSGMSDYLSKPFTSQELWACLMRHLMPVGFTPNSETEMEESKSDIRLFSGDIIDEKSGVEKSGGDEKFYRRIQRNFVKDNRNIMEMIRNSLYIGEIDTAHLIVHTLKSSARLIGAEKLALLAQDAEFSLEGQKNACTADQLNDLEAALQEVLTAIDSVSITDKAPVGKADENLDRNQAAELTGKLYPLLKSGNPESADYLEEVRTIFAPLGGDCDRLAGQIEEYDLDKAFETLCAIKETLKI